MTPPQLWIDGAPCPAASGATFPTENPATGETLADLPRGSGPDIDAAVAAAKRAGPAWARLDPYERQRILWKAGELIAARVSDLALLETLDTGKPLSNARAIDVPRAADTFFYFSGWATKFGGETIPVRGPYLNYTLREPLGVIGAIIPWNFPLLLAARKIAASLAVGNTVVLKPPEEASLSTLLLGEILSEAGVPPGVCNVVSGLGEEAGAALVAHPDVAKISFTGGTDTGKMIQRNAAATLKRVSLELGGKSPNIVFADADLSTAAKSAVRAAFYNSGQLCTSGSRLLVERSAYDSVVEQVVAGAQGMVVGDPLDPATQIGPMISEAHHRRVLSYVDAGDTDGARRLTGGARGGPGYFVTPTVFGGVNSGMRIAREEIFGPVLSILPFDTLEEAAAIADATEFGLAAGIWTRNIGRAHALASRLRAGTVWINAYNLFDAASPYGGYKQSGFGRENGAEVLRDLTQVKSVWVNLS